MTRFSIGCPVITSHSVAGSSNLNLKGRVWSGASGHAEDRLATDLPVGLLRLSTLPLRGQFTSPPGGTRPALLALRLTSSACQ